jgi:hypothetical protein
MTDKNEWWEGNVFWKMIFRNLTPQTQRFIQDDVSKRLAEQRGRIAKMVEGMKKKHTEDHPHPTDRTCLNLICVHNAALDAVIEKLTKEI